MNQMRSLFYSTATISKRFDSVVLSIGRCGRWKILDVVRVNSCQRSLVSSFHVSVGLKICLYERVRTVRYW